MDSETNVRNGLFLGALIGAVLGAGAAYLLMTIPADADDDPTNNPLKGRELLALLSAGAVLIRKLDDVRRRT